MSSPPPSSSHPPPPHYGAPTVLSPAEMTAALRDLATAVREIHLFLAGPYGPQPAAPPATTTGPLLLPWQPPHLAPQPAAPPAATTGPLLLPWQPPHLAVSAAVAATTPPWLPWPSQPLAGPVAAMAPLQQPAPLPLSPGPATTAPAGVPIQQVRLPPSPSPLPSSIATRHVSAAVRLQAAARGLLARRRVREMRGLQLPLLQVALRCAHDLALARCVGALGHAVSPTSGGHAVFPVCSDLIVCDIGGWGGAHPSSTGARRVTPLHSAAGRREGASAGRSCDLFQVAIHMHFFCPAGVHGIQVAVYVHVRRADGVHT